MVFVAAVVLALPALADLALRGDVRRLALRNAARRPVEAVLVVGGAMLGTAIITASFVVGDTVDAAIIASAHRTLGPIDEVVNLPGAADLASTLERLGPPAAAGAAGYLPRLALPAPVARVGGSPRAVANAELVEVDFDAARRLGGDPAATGFADAGPTPTGDELVLSERVAGLLDVAPGDRLDAHIGDRPERFTVRAVIAERGIAGYGTQGRINGGEPVFVGPGTIDRLRSTGSSVPAPTASILVSNGTGVVPAVDRTNDVTARVRDLGRPPGGRPLDVTKAKQNVVLSADRSADSIRQLYQASGLFSVAAGVLLLVNLFVMLAEERRSELGIMRAVGMTRSRLVRSFWAEGTLYSVVAAALGGVLGVGVGWAIARLSDAILTSPNAQPYPFTFRVPSLLTGTAVGLSISLVTVLLTSVFVSRLSIIQAIRGGAERAHRPPGTAARVLAALGTAGGLALTLEGIRRSAPMATVAGLPLALLSLLLATRGHRRRRAITVAVCLVVLVWTGGIYSLLPDAMGTPKIDTFAVEGLILVGAATLLAANGDRLWAAAARRASGRGVGLATRLGLAYPVARRSRTGMLLGMFSSVIFTMTFLTEVSTVFAGQRPILEAELRGGFDLYVDSSPANPVTGALLAAQPDVVATAGLVRSLPRFTNSHEPTPKNGTFTGFDESLVAPGPPLLVERMAPYADDAAVYRAVLADPTLAIVPSTFLRSGNGPTGDIVDPGDPLTVHNPVTGAQLQLRVAGVYDLDINGFGVLVGKPVIAGLMGPLAAEVRQFAVLRPGADPRLVAHRLQVDLIDHGVRAVAFGEDVDRVLGQREGFFALLRGFLALGLVIGVVGMGVVMVRAVRERRREIGMLRAMGVGARTVRRSFLIEAAFVASQGVVVGMGLAVLVSYQVLVHSSAFGDRPLPFAVPVGTLAAQALLPVVAVLIAAALPAAQAARTKPAVALRIAD